MDKFKELQSIITETEKDVVKFYEAGNKSAAVRIRKAMQEVKNLAQEIRLHVQETKNNM